MRCGWCGGDGENEKCPRCSGGRKPFFPKKAKKRIDDTLPTAKCKHGKVDTILTEYKYLCECGSIIKVDI